MIRRWSIPSAVVAVSVMLAGCDYVPDYVRALFGKSKEVATRSAAKGKFKGDLDVRFLSTMSGDGQRVEMIQLLQPFGYTDAKGIDWDVPAGYLSDGASIPRELWAVLGGPFSGPYRDAAVVHDFYCWSKRRKWEDTHEVFLEAAINRGTSESLAKYMYAGILFGGPRWPEPKKAAELAVPFVRAQMVPTPAPSAATTRDAGKSDKQVFDDLKTWIERDKPTLEEIKKRVEEIRKEQTKTAPK